MKSGPRYVHHRWVEVQSEVGGTSLCCVSVCISEGERGLPEVCPRSDLPGLFISLCSGDSRHGRGGLLVGGEKGRGEKGGVCIYSSSLASFSLFCCLTLCRRQWKKNAALSLLFEALPPSFTFHAVQRERGEGERKKEEEKPITAECSLVTLLSAADCDVRAAASTDQRTNDAGALRRDKTRGAN